MQLLHLLFLIVPVLSSPLSNHQSRTEHCLSDNDVKSLLDKWNPIWTENSDLSTLDNFVSKRFKFYQEDFTDGKDVPVADGLSAFQSYLVGLDDPKSGYAVATKQITTYEFHNCNRIANRWRAELVTTGAEK